MHRKNFIAELRKESLRHEVHLQIPKELFESVEEQTKLQYPMSQNIPHCYSTILGYPSLIFTLLGFLCSYRGIDPIVNCLKAGGGF
jgi:hypothetical protein